MECHRLLCRGTMRDRGLSHRGATLGRLGERRSGTARREQRKKIYNHKKKKKSCSHGSHLHGRAHTLCSQTTSTVNIDNAKYQLKVDWSDSVTQRTIPAIHPRGTFCFFQSFRFRVSTPESRACHGQTSTTSFFLFSEMNGQTIYQSLHNES